MVRAADFTATFRRGSRAATPRIVVHAQADKSLQESVLVGFVVPKKQISRAHGRNLVKRRLRHLMRNYLPTIPQGTRVVIRAQAAALTASYNCLNSDLQRCIPQAITREQNRTREKEATHA